MRQAMAAVVACCLCLAGGPAPAAAQTDGSGPTACTGLPAASPGLAWDYTPPEAGHQPRLLCAADDVASLVAAGGGTWGLAIRDFASGETLMENGDEPFTGGSLYKLGVAVEAYARIADGTLGEGSPIAISAQDVDPEYGGSQYVAGTTLTVDEALKSMLTLSDNGAALALVDRLGLAAVNQQFVTLGMPDTHLDYDAQTTPHDMLQYFTLMEHGELISSDVSQRLVQLLEAQQINDRIPAGLPDDQAWRVAHKTANIDDMMGDAGVVYTPSGDYAIILLNQGLVSYDQAVETSRALSARAYLAIVETQHDS